VTGFLNDRRVMSDVVSPVCGLCESTAATAVHVWSLSGHRLVS